MEQNPAEYIPFRVSDIYGIIKIFTMVVVCFDRISFVFEFREKTAGKGRGGREGGRRGRGRGEREGETETVVRVAVRGSETVREKRDGKQTREREAILEDS